HTNELLLGLQQSITALEKNVLRRLAMGRRQPVNPATLKGISQEARIERLIQDLDLVGDASPRTAEGAQIVNALLAEGTAAIKPLQKVIAEDDRLCRTMKPARWGIYSFQLVSVKDIAYSLLDRLQGKPPIRDI